MEEGWREGGSRTLCMQVKVHAHDVIIYARRVRARKLLNYCAPKFCRGTIVNSNPLLGKLFFDQSRGINCKLLCLTASRYVLSSASHQP